MRPVVYCSIITILLCKPLFLQSQETTKQQTTRYEATKLTLNFDVFYSAIKIGQIHQVFTSQNGEYSISCQVLPNALVKLLYGDMLIKSTGRIIPTSHLETIRYEVERDRYPKKNVTLDRSTGTLHFRQGKKQQTTDLPQMIVADYLSALYYPYISQQLSSGKITLVHDWQVKEYEYTAGQPEQLQTPLGDITARPVIYEARRGKRIIWFATDIEFMPVKVYINNNSHVFSAMLTSITKE